MDTQDLGLEPVYLQLSTVSYTAVSVISQGISWGEAMNKETLVYIRGAKQNVVKLQHIYPNAEQGNTYDLGLKNKVTFSSRALVGKVSELVEAD